jgi:hypothetical protein
VTGGGAFPENRDWDYNFGVRAFSASAPERPRPLHRLTPLGNDPIAGWLGTSSTGSIVMIGFVLWAAYALSWASVIVFLPLALGFFGLLIRRVIWVFSALTGASLVPAMRRAVVRAKNNRLQRLVRSAAALEAVQVDEWSTLDGEPDGRAVSVVGWVKGRHQLATPVGGEPCVGIALGCVQNYPGVVESLHDFDLVDDDGRVMPIRVAGGRLLGEPNARVFANAEGRLLVASLDLPAGAVSTSDALVLRDGDAVMVIGFKTSLVDPSEVGMRQAPVRTALVSAESKPLLLYPIPGQHRAGGTARG